MPRPINMRLLRRTGTLIVYFLLTSIFWGCGGALYRVKPVVDLPPLPDSTKNVTSGGLTLRVAPLLSDEQTQELFEANLPVSGLLPIRMELVYESGEPLELKRLRVVVRDSAGREWKFVSAKQATGRILKANGIYAYNPNSRKQFEKEFGSYEIDLKTPLTTGEHRRQGFLFFVTPDKRPVQQSESLTLIVERLAQPLEIKLN